VKRIGGGAFQSFLQQEKKDIILFQLEIALKDAGSDPTRKSAVVNHIAESISRINKTEDFTRQQDYIKRCSELLRIDEEGLTALVNKHIRERLQTEEKKQMNAAVAEAETAPEPEAGEALELLLKDELQEQGLVRCLMEFGIKPWDQTITVADFVFAELEASGLNEMFDNKQLLRILNTYREWYKMGLEPTPKSFLYHEDQQLNVLAVSLMDNSSFEISPNWDAHYDRPAPTREELYHAEVNSCMNYLKLRKIRRLILENQKDMERTMDNAEMQNLIETHHHLKNMEMDLARKAGTVIIR